MNKTKLKDYIKKLIKEEYINEIGQASAKPYKYSKIKRKFDSIIGGSKESVYFETDSGLEYFVDLRPLNGYLEVDFGIEADNKDDMYKETNRGELFKVMSTIVSIIKDVIKLNPELKGLRYIPQEKGNNGHDKGVKRDKLYKAFIKKQFPKIKFIKQGVITYAQFLK